MAKRLIVKEPDPILHKNCRVVENFDQKLWTLLDDMKETLIEADGAGLAAPQVAVLKRCCLVMTEDGFFELINPVIKSAKGSQKSAEGCLSIPGKWGEVERFNEVKVEAQDRFGNKQVYKVKGFTAKAFQHEIDHLDGILFTSKCDKLTED